MTAILSLHQDFIHFNLASPWDREDKEKAQAYVEEKTCAEWRRGFLTVDGTPFNLFQKPGWYGEGFYDHKSNYSVSNQVFSSKCFIHKLTLFLVDYLSP